MPCLICGEHKTVKAHLMPKCFVEEVKGERTTKSIVFGTDERNFMRSPTGLYDKNILCKRCDALLGKYENFAFRVLSNIRADVSESRSSVEVNPFDNNMLLRFCASVVWKYANTQMALGKINIGPYEKILRDFIFHSIAIPNSVNCLMVLMYRQDKEAYFYRAPLYDRKNSINFIRFSVASFLFLLKLDKRRSDLVEEKYWIANKDRLTLLVAPMEEFSEWKEFSRSWESARAQNYFDPSR